MFEDFRLKVYVTVAEELNFTAAARRLGISQPAVSQHIAELEKELGAKFVDRTGPICLTKEGELLYDYARQILHWYSLAAQSFRQDPLKVRSTAVKPVPLELDGGKSAKIWADGDNIHIELIGKKA